MEWIRVNEKRFNFVGGYLYDGNDPIGHVEDIKFRQDFEDIVNNQHKENIKLQNRLDDKDDLLRKQLAISQNLNKQLAEREKEIIDIKTTIKQMMENERTKLGYNALKQAYEAIQWNTKYEKEAYITV